MMKAQLIKKEVKWTVSGAVPLGNNNKKKYFILIPLDVN